MPTRALRPQEKALCYEALAEFNRGLTNSVQNLRRLQGLKFLGRDVYTALQVALEETRSWANVEVIEVLLQGEIGEWGRYGRRRRQWEKRFEDSNDLVLKSRAFEEARPGDRRKKTDLAPRPRQENVQQYVIFPDTAKPSLSIPRALLRTILVYGSVDGLHLIEGITRVAPDEKCYEITVDDPTTWTKSWTAVQRLKQTEERIFQLACHEGKFSDLGGHAFGGRVHEDAALMIREATTQNLPI